MLFASYTFPTLLSHRSIQETILQKKKILVKVAIRLVLILIAALKEYHVVEIA
jgi:hypothetical protein